MAVLGERRPDNRQLADRDAEVLRGAAREARSTPAELVAAARRYDGEAAEAHGGRPGDELYGRLGFNGQTCVCK